METMNALIMRDGSIGLESVEIPTPEKGQVLVKSLACGICGSDLHITHHASEVFDLYRSLGIMSDAQDDHTGIMLGHEFCAEVVRHGPQTPQTHPVGSRVTCVPILMTQHQAGIGVTPGVVGAYSEYFIVDEALLLAVPDGLPNEAAALTEPLAVGLHAVNRSAIQPGDVALVAGCGPIGLAVIAALTRRGIETIVASDPNGLKRELAGTLGASHLANPAEEDEVALATDVASGQRVVIFECIGIHTLIDAFIKRAPVGARLVITGVHTTPSEIHYAYATVKELDLTFSYYYTAQEFAECLAVLGDGELAWQHLLTAKVGIDGVSGAFDELTRNKDHIKVMIEPWRRGALEPFQP